VGLTKKLVGATLGMATLAVDAARHAAWLLGYHVDRRTRDATEEDKD
jgi:hypothetical protein